MIGRPLVPVAMCQDTRICGDVEVPGRRGGQAREMTAPRPGVERLLVSARETRAELGHLKGHASFQLIIARMERTLDATLLHLVRTRLVDDYPAQIGECLDLMDDTDVWWRPDETVNALGNLVLHLAGSNRYYVGYGIGGRETHRDRDAEFAARANPGRGEIVRHWHETTRVCAEVLGAIVPSDLMNTTSRTGKETTIAALLLHVSHHTAVHVGQIVWITKMRHPGALSELWIRTRDRLASARKS